MSSYKETRTKELIQEATTLIDLDRNVVKAVVESTFEKIPTLLSEFRETKISVLKKFNELSIVENVDDGTRQILDRVQREFPTDNIIRHLENETGADSSFFELSEEEAGEIGSDLLYSWISHYEYVHNLFKINTLILKTSIPAELSRYLNEVRNCFAFEQNNAVISMCRTIIEAAAKDLCEKLGFFAGYGDKVIEINPKVFNQLIRSVAKGRLKKKAIQIYYRDACPVVHGDKVVNSDVALRVLRETIDVVQGLYSSNGF